VTENIPEIEAGGETRRLGLLMPPAGYEDDTPLLSAVPGFRTWSRQEIEDFIRAKPYEPRRKTFRDGWKQNQRSWGSCNACATAYVQRKGQYLRGRIDTQMLDWEFLYAQINGGRDNGSLLKDGMAVCHSIGMPALDPSANGQGRGRIYKSHYTQADYDAAKVNKGTKTLGIPASNKDEFERTLATAVLSGFPAVVAVHVGSRFSNLVSGGFAGSDSGAGNHAVHVDDVEIVNGELAFDHDGSWGTQMHDEGRALLTYERHFRQTSQYHLFWVLMSTNDGDDPLPK